MSGFNDPRIPHIMHAPDMDLLLESIGGPERSAEMDKVLERLPQLTENQIISLGHKDSVCPICYNTFLAILAEQEMAEVMDSPAHPAEELGVTRLSQEWQCGHLFCRRDITKWINEGKVTCPTCRRPLAKSGAESNQGNPAPTPDEQADAMEQFRQSIQRFLSNSGPDGAPAFGSSTSHSADSRSEFSSMYS